MGIIKETKKGQRIQLHTDLSFKEAFSLCTDLRSLHDDNYYWIGTL